MIDGGRGMPRPYANPGVSHVSEPGKNKHGPMRGAGSLDRHCEPVRGAPPADGDCPLRRGAQRPGLDCAILRQGGRKARHIDH